MKEFLPNCTLPTTDPVGFVDGSNIRSTTDIIWSCGTVVVLSTWSVLHLTVPPQLQPASKTEKICKQLYLLGRKLGWMGIMLAFPEYLVGISTVNLFAAWVNHKALERAAEEDGVPWSMTHTILSNIGGIAIRFADSEIGQKVTCEKLETVSSDGSAGGRTSSPSKDPQQHSLADVPPVEPMQAEEFLRPRSAPYPPHLRRLYPPSTETPEFIRVFDQKHIKHSRKLGISPWRLFGHHVALAADVYSAHDPAENKMPNYFSHHVAPLLGDIWIVDSKQLLLARRSGIIRSLPKIENEEIADKSKIDGLMRIVSMTQVLWLAVELISRRIENIPSSALEVSTVAFSACAVIIYAIEWDKPKDIGVPFYMDAVSEVSLAAFRGIAESGPIAFLQFRYYHMPMSCVHQVIEGRYSKKHIDRLMVLTTILSITLYGGIHLFAWNLQFPTSVEQRLWRAAALVVAIAPTVSALLVLMEDLASGRTDKLSQWSVTVLAPAYVSARLFIIVESFRSLYYLPPAAFIATWASNAPHIG